MDVAKLVSEVDSPNLHQALLGDFEGPYSLGVRRDKDSAKAVLLLMVPPDIVQAFPAHVTVAGEKVPVEVQRTFRHPAPLHAIPSEAAG
jgi:hypothetical protein